MKKVSNIMWGIALVALGIVLALNALNITNIDLFFDGWWTLFILVPSAVGLVTGKDKTGSLIGILIGAALLLACQDILDFDLLWKLAIPVIILIFGIKLIFKNITGNKGDAIVKTVKANGEDVKTSCATFSSQDIRFDNEEVKALELVSVFGGIKCDLRNAKIENDIAINAQCIFGGIDIFVPDTVNIKVNSNSIFGGIDADKHINSADNRFTVYLNGTCIFGGVDIK